MKKLLKRAMPYLPRSIQNALRSVAERRRQIEKVNRKERTQVCLADLQLILEQLDAGGDVLVHSSLSNIGKFDCRAGDVADVLIKRFSREGRTLIVPSLPYQSTMKEYLDQLVAFDVRTAPNAMGAIPNIVMSQDRALRSVHPSHPAVALGDRSLHYTSGHELDRTPFGPNSPYWKLNESAGFILMLGVGLNSVTNFHVYEDLLGEFMPIQVYLPNAANVPCTRYDGSEASVRAVCHDPRVSAVRQCERARSFLHESGVIRTLRFGESEVSMIDAKGFTRTLLTMLLAGHSIYGPVTLTAQQVQKTSDLLARLA